MRESERARYDTKRTHFRQHFLALHIVSQLQGVVAHVEQLPAFRWGFDVGQLDYAPTRDVKVVEYAFNLLEQWVSWWSFCASLTHSATLCKALRCVHVVATKQLVLVIVIVIAIVSVHMHKALFN